MKEVMRRMILNILNINAINVDWLNYSRCVLVVNIVKDIIYNSEEL